MGLPETTNVKSGDFPKTIPDWYEMVFKASEEKRDKNNALFTRLELGFADSERLAWTNLSHHKDFLWKVKQFKEAIGMDDIDTELAGHKGTHLMVFCKNKVYEGSNYPEPTKFKAMASASSAPTPPADDSDLPF